MSVYSDLGIKPCQVNTVTRTVDADKGKILESGTAQAKWHIYYKKYANDYGIFSEGYEITPSSFVGTNWFARKNFLIRRPRVFRVICGASFPRFNGAFDFIPPTEFGPSHPYICAGDTFLHQWLASNPTPANYSYLYQQAILNLLDSWLAPYRVTPVLMSTVIDPFGIQIYTPAEVATPKATPPDYIGGEIYTLYLSMSQSQLQSEENWAHSEYDQHAFSQGNSGFDYTGCPLIVIIMHQQLPCKGEYGIYTVPFGPLNNIADGANPPVKQAENKALLEAHMIESYYYKYEVAILAFTEVQWSTSLYSGPYYFPVQKLCGYNNPHDLTRNTRNWARFNSVEATQDMQAAYFGVLASIPTSVASTWNVSVTLGFSVGTTVESVATALFNKALNVFGYAQWP